MGHTNTVCKKDTPGRHLLQIPTKEALVFDKVHTDLLSDLLNNVF